MKLIVEVLLCSIFVFSAVAQEEPDLKKLLKSGYIVGPGSNQYPVHKSWTNYIKVMGELNIYDDVVSRMIDVFCSDDQNRSVLLVGEASDAYRYVFARLAQMQKPKGCVKDWHIEVDINKIEAGHKYVGEVDEYWLESILNPVDGKDAILYFRSLWSLIGIGSHSNDASGIETEYSANILAGRMKTVAFVNKYEYERIRNSEHSYVVNSFAEKINLEALIEDDVRKMVKTYLKVLYPNVLLSKSNRKYLINTLQHYQPNINEPERTMNVLKSLLRKVKTVTTRTDIVLESAVETPHEYEPNSNLEFIINRPEVVSLAIVFDSFHTERVLDTLRVYDAVSGVELARYSGELGAFESEMFKTNSLRLVFNSNSLTQFEGFVITQVKGERVEPYRVSFENVRDAVFSFIQVPEWIVDKKFKRIKNLEQYLSEDVIGADQGRQAVVREAKIGYVVGRTTKKPVANLLLAGPTGTGKSHLAKSTASALDMRIVTFDMTGYQTDASFERFVETMARSLTLYPFAIYLFEEIDKANPSILDQLFFLMDDGLFYDKFQRPLSARGAFIFMTTNAGHEVILENPNHPELERLANEALQQTFRLSFLNRFNDVVISRPFTLDQYRQMSNTLYLKKAGKVKKRFGWTLTMDAQSLEFIAINGQSPLYGSRPIERLMENIIIGGIAEFQLEYGNLNNHQAEINFTKNPGDNLMFTINVDEVSLEFEADIRNNNGHGFLTDDNKFLRRIGPRDKVPFRAYLK